ncbi:hypothetical protein ACQUFE_18230, partial [Enterococcus casseliflavus]|uniref:hypothetical protein n=1 Tax=Enterococcus casseliflavus TaxID=37734 RepID=UPI003D0BA9F2
IETARRLRLRIAGVVRTGGALHQASQCVLFGTLMAYAWATDETAQMSGFILVVIYVTGPVSQLIQYVPTFTEAQVAYRRIAEFA